MIRPIRTRSVFMILKRFATYDHLMNNMKHEYTPRRFRPLRLPQYGGVNLVTMLPGGGIGPEMMTIVKTVFEATRAPIEFEEITVSPQKDMEQCNADFRDGLLSIRRNGVAIKGHIEHQWCDLADYSRNVALRQNLDLYVNVVTYKSYPGISKALHQDLDLVVVRQNTEGEYTMLEHEPVPGVVQNMKIVTEYNSQRLARYAFEYARANNRRNVVCIHRRHILPAADGMFVDTATRVAAEYPDIGFEERLVSTTVKELSQKPSAYDIILCTNLYGSLLNNMLFGLIGSPALVSSRNYGDNYAVFETGHRCKGSSLTGKGVANPVAMLNAGVDLLRYLGHDYHACLIARAIEKTINVDKVHTFDIGGTATTQDVVDNIIQRVADSPCVFPVESY